MGAIFAAVVDVNWVRSVQVTSRCCPICITVPELFRRQGVSRE